ncbi:MAG: hypothetical protein AAF152_00425 [Cyanobacteria bacterium P01_A01_bin.114]
MVRGALAKYYVEVAKGGGVAIAAVLLTAAVGQARPADEVYQQFEALNQAVCFNQWEQATAIASTLIGSPAISTEYRHSLVAFRHQLTQLSEARVQLPDHASCNLVSNITLTVPTADESSEDATPIDWAAAIASISANRGPLVQFDNRTEAEVNPPIPPELLADIPGVLASATPLDTTEGFDVAAGEVGSGHQAFSFLAGLGDRITLDLDVTRVLPGTGGSSDDSQLFVFDRSGRLIAHNDDADGRQSLIADFAIPETAVYFVVVTSHDNDPVFGDDQALIGWDEDGDARFSYTLTLTGATPAAALLR